MEPVLTALQDGETGAVLRRELLHTLTGHQIVAPGISKSHLYRVFSQELGISPVQFLIRYRVGEACAMLRGSAMSVGEVAASCGFRDPLYFSRIFRKVKGTPPREYAKNGGE